MVSFGQLKDIMELWGQGGIVWCGSMVLHMYRTGIVLWQAFAGPSYGGMEDSGFGCYGLLGGIWLRELEYEKLWMISGSLGLSTQGLRQAMLPGCPCRAKTPLFSPSPIFHLPWTWLANVSGYSGLYV